MTFKNKIDFEVFLEFVLVFFSLFIRVGGFAIIEVGGDPGKIILGQKRCSTDTDTGQSEPKKIKSEENSNDYKKSSSWTLWSLVWPRRKQVVK